MADLDSILTRPMPPEPWAEGEKIPWDEPGFSERMLAEHLSQTHDAASRRTTTVEAQVAWIHDEVLSGEPARILDLGCGPGLYASRLARLGHTVRGIDFSPASIQYARDQATAAGLEIDYQLGDIRETAYRADTGAGSAAPFDLVMFLFGEINVFRREQAAAILARAAAALVPGGRLLLEASTFEAVRSIGDAPARAQAVESGLFSPKPHDLLEEAFWDEPRSLAMRRWIVVDRESDSVVLHADTTVAYTDGEVGLLVETAGFAEATLRTDWPLPDEQQGKLFAYLGQMS